MIEDMKLFVMGMPASVSDSSRVTVSSLTMGDCRTIAAWMTPRPLDEWSEEDGPVLWWCFTVAPAPIGVPGFGVKLQLLGEPPYVGSPLDLGITVEAHTTTRVITQSNQDHDPEPVIHRIHAGGWPGYHTHWTPLPKVVTP